MTEETFYELLEEARTACGKNAAALSAFIGARIPDTDLLERRAAVEAIQRFTGKRVELPACEAQSDADATPATASAVECDLCQVCGKPLAVGQQGCIVRIVPHEPVLAYHPFIPYFDFALGKQIDSFAGRWKAMRPEYDGDEVVRGKLEYRDKISRGDLSARADRLNEQRKDSARRG